MSAAAAKRPASAAAEPPLPSPAPAPAAGAAAAAPSPASSVDTLRITPLGSGSEVGRSCILLDCRGRRVLLDCGIHPGLAGIASLPYFDEVDLATARARGRSCWRRRGVCARTHAPCAGGPRPRTPPTPRRPSRRPHRWTYCS